MAHVAYAHRQKAFTEAAALHSGGRMRIRISGVEGAGVASSDRDALARQLAMIGIKESFPELASRFDAVAKAYFDDRKSALRPDGADATLGWGDPVTIGLGIVCLYVADKIVDYYATVILEHVGGTIRRLVRRGSKMPESVTELPQLDEEQEEALRAYVQKGANEYGIAALAGEVFDQLVKHLRRTRKTEGPLNS